MTIDRPVILRISPLLLVLLALAYLIPGLVGHDPWKSADAIGIGIVHQMLQHGQWLLPHLAGELYPGDGPFTYWVAALTAKLFGGLIATHDGARIASGLLMSATLWFTFLAAREFHGWREKPDATESTGAALILMGCVGLLVHAHEMLAELGALAGLSLSWYAIALSQREPRRAGWLLGLGIAISILSKGPMMAFAPAASALLAPAISSAWRRRAYGLTLLAAMVVIAIVIGGWMILAKIRHAPLDLWWQRSLRLYAIPDGHALLGWTQLLLWSACPAWPIAAWTLWEQRRKSFEPGIRLLIVAISLSLATLLAQPADEIAALPLLLPLALLASAGLASLRRGAANALMWFSLMGAALFCALVWLGWFAMATGMPQAIASSFTRLEPGFAFQFSWIAFTPALILTLGWLWLLLKSGRTSPLRGIALWSSGLILMWALLTTLWLQWIDYGRSYRPVAMALKKVLPPEHRCIASLGLGPSQRAVFDYHAGIITERLERHPEAARCSLLLVQAHYLATSDRGPGWKLLWEGRRPRDQERYRLYRKQP